MMHTYAEVIGDPIAQTKSPAIHGHWLAQVGIDAEYRAVRVERDALGSYLDSRRGDPNWRGCNVTIPHKEAIAPLLDRLAPEARAIGAINCVIREGDCLVGYNTDVDGIAEALQSVAIEGRRVALIGAGGAARAMIAYLSRKNPGEVTVLARDPAKAERLRSAAGALELKFVTLEEGEALRGSAVIVNASPLGMEHAPDMPIPLLQAIASAAGASTTLFDMVYRPLGTDFLQVGASAGARTIDGLTMLIGQARTAFRHFFGALPPADHQELLGLLNGSAEPELSRTI